MVSGDENFAGQVMRDYREAELTPRQRALCEFAEKLTRNPARMSADEVNRLRATGLEDREILDAVQIISYFNYINRVAGALGIDPEPEMESAWKEWQVRKER
ncbi:MAG: peroxidase-related enzyme [Acidobacteria bacterium]|nr:peroxidase-related enzyme [Acidobacteriota bacterium]